MPRTTTDEDQIRTLADAAAGTFLRSALTYSAMIQHAGAEWQALAAHVEQGRCAHLPDEQERRSEAENITMFEIGLAVGRLTAGVR